MQLFSVEATMFFYFFFPWKHEAMTSKRAHNQPNFFSVMPTGPNPAQISIPVPQKSPTAGLLYNDFVWQYVHFNYNFKFVPFRFKKKGFKISGWRQTTTATVTLVFGWKWPKKLPILFKHYSASIKILTRSLKQVKVTHLAALVRIATFYEKSDVRELELVHISVV